MLFAVIGLAWFAAIVLGLTMFRLAALSDRFQARALADWMRSHRVRTGATIAEQTADRSDSKGRRGVFRATG